MLLLHRPTLAAANVASPSKASSSSSAWWSREFVNPRQTPSPWSWYPRPTTTTCEAVSPSSPTATFVEPSSTAIKVSSFSSASSVEPAAAPAPSSLETTRSTWSSSRVAIRRPATLPRTWATLAALRRRPTLPGSAAPSRRWRRCGRRSKELWSDTTANRGNAERGAGNRIRVRRGARSVAEGGLAGGGG